MRLGWGGGGWERFRIVSGDRFLPTGQSSVSIKGMEFLDRLYDYRFLMTKSAPAGSYYYDFKDHEYGGRWVLRNAAIYLRNLHSFSSQRTVVLIAANSKLLYRNTANIFTLCTYCKVKRNVDSLNAPAVIPKCYTAVTRKTEYKFLTRKTNTLSTLHIVHSGSDAHPQLVQRTLTSGK